MTPVAVGTDGGMRVAAGESMCMIAVESLFGLLPMACFTPSAAFQLKFAVVPGGIFRMRELPDIFMARCATQVSVNRRPQCRYIDCEQQFFRTGKLSGKAPGCVAADTGGVVFGFSARNPGKKGTGEKGGNARDK